MSTEWLVVADASHARLLRRQRDAAYDEASGARFWVLRDDRMPAGRAGRFLVVDSARDERAAWAPSPAAVPGPRPRTPSPRPD